MAVVLTGLLLFTGLAVDSGRAYVVKAQLTKAVDAAALGAARNLNSGDPRAEAGRIFQVNFPSGYMGTNWVTDPGDASFYSLVTNASSGTNVITIAASTTMPTSFMKLGNFDHVTVSSSGQATRRMVDLSLVLDVSSSIGSKWTTVHDAAQAFVNSFDGAHDRMALLTYVWDVTVLDAMPSSRGFNKAKVVADVPAALPGGVTPMNEGVYRAWDELRTVPAGQQSSIRVIVLFTDGSGNVVPGLHDGSGISKGLFTSDFPKCNPDPDNITTNNPSLLGVYNMATGVRNPSCSATATPWSAATTCGAPTPVPYLPVGTQSFHSTHRSAGIPINFLLQTNALTVNGTPQSTIRGLTNWNAGVSRYAAHASNIRRAATNLTEIIADAARSDTSGDYKIRIYTLGMGSLVNCALGPNLESSASVLRRIANDTASPDFNSAELTGNYYFAPTPDDVGPMFQNIQNQIIRLTK